MARIEEGIFRNYNPGDRMTDVDYERDREIVRVAINDVEDSIDALQSETAKIEVVSNDILKVNEDISIIGGLNDNTVTPTYTDGQLTLVEEKNGSTVKASTALTYNIDGTVNTITEIINGSTVISTLNYINGEFSSVTKELA
ncbi:hypothetical protein AB1K32_15055 [Metabacillus dongyingensis]|uniref:hypothetical protein n=1 Tax=Metabacillus dongyingensis TaxID=2874282 RepID=UPI003B8DC820